jgi:hypothetical protein
MCINSKNITTFASLKTVVSFYRFKNLTVPPGTSRVNPNNRHNLFAGFYFVVTPNIQDGCNTDITRIGISKALNMPVVLFLKIDQCWQRVRPFTTNDLINYRNVVNKTILPAWKELKKQYPVKLRLTNKLHKPQLSKMREVKGLLSINF